MRSLHRLCALALLTALSGCAPYGAPIDSSRDALSPEERRLQAVEDKLADLNRRVEGLANVSSAQGAGSLGDELRRLRGDIEELRHTVNENDARTHQLYQDLDRRLRALEGGAPPAAGGAGPSGAAGEGQTIGAAPPAANQAAPEEETAYLKAFDLLKAGKYNDATPAFQQVVDTWPQGKYADSAVYWQGEAHYVKREFKDAIERFQTLVQRYPRSQRMPDALLKMGFAQAELKQSTAARATLNRVIQEYPNSTAANLARQRLQQMGH